MRNFVKMLLITSSAFDSINNEHVIGTPCMATDTRLSAIVPTHHINQLRTYADDHNINVTDAEREIIKQGLAANGYLETPTTPTELLTHYTRITGNILGFVGLIMIGYGIFGATLFSYIGFGLVLTGFSAIAGTEFGPALINHLNTTTT